MPKPALAWVVASDSKTVQYGMDVITPSRIFLAFLRLGITAFGGPVAHLGYFHRTLIVRHKWLDEHSYAELVALCQLLPGPSSSQVGIGIGFAKAGWRGAIAAWIGFTLPSAILMTAFGLGVHHFGSSVPQWLLHGLILVAVPVVAQAVWLMSKQLCPDWPRRSIAGAVALAALWLQPATLQPLLIVAGGILGWMILKNREAGLPAGLPAGSDKRIAPILLGLFVLLLLGLPLASAGLGAQSVREFAAFYRSGALVFGGGHVVLPLLQSAVVPPAWVSGKDFLAGYGMAQAMPGPLFSFAAYLGTVMKPFPNGIAGAVLCLVAIYLPSFLLVTGALPLWQAVRHRPGFGRALRGINAAVVGLLLAALYHPVLTSAITDPADAALALAGLVLLVALNLPSWAVVVLTVAGAGLAHMFLGAT
jgi:chromate transporter